MIFLARINLIVAVVPGVFLLYYVYKHDTIEKEPMPLLISLLALGVLSAFVACFLETLGAAFLDSESAAYMFLAVATAEEGAKYVFLKLRTWRHPAFDYRYDAVVYAVFVSLGFAIFENVEYVFSYGLMTGLFRAVTAVPAHLSFSVFMGVHYGTAKLLEKEGDLAGSQRARLAAFFIPWFCHGLYDSLASSMSSLASLLFLIFIILMFRRAFTDIKKSSLMDQHL